VAPYDTRDTLARLDVLVARYRPKSLILLGDTFHDRLAWHQLEETVRTHFLELSSDVFAALAPEKLFRPYLAYRNLIVPPLSSLR
jgi:metallophosphoesterase superfamily enzyme